MSTDVLVTMADHVRQLCEPVIVVRRVSWWSKSGHRKMRLDEWQFPSLLDQLRSAVQPGQHPDAAAGRRPPTSRPAAVLEPIDLLCRLDAGVRLWRVALDLTPGAGLEDGLRAMVGAAGQVDAETRAAMAHDVGVWWMLARAMTRNG